MGEPSIWDHLAQQIFLGDEAFVRKLQQRLNADVDLSEVPKAQRRPPPKPLRHYAVRYKDPHEAMAQAHR